MLVELLIPISCFIVTFGIVYLFLSTRHRERMALIEKGADASLFKTGKGPNHSKIIILNIALTMIGIGLGTLIALFLYQATGYDEVYPASIFLMAGLGLLASFFIGKKYSA